MQAIIVVLILVIGFGLLWWLYWYKQQPVNPITTTNFYDLSVVDINGNTLAFSSFAGKKVLIVNIASRCGFTPQLSSLQNLYELYQDRLIILGVPSNQFLNQSPENEWEMRQFCQRNYGVGFLLSEKVAVRWPDQHPVYQRLTRKSLNGVKGSVVKRNFQKYLVDEEGSLIDVFSPTVEPFDEKIVNHLT